MLHTWHYMVPRSHCGLQAWYLFMDMEKTTEPRRDKTLRVVCAVRAVVFGSLRATLPSQRAVRRMANTSMPCIPLRACQVAGCRPGKHTAKRARPVKRDKPKSWHMSCSHQPVGCERLSLQHRGTRQFLRQTLRLCRPESQNIVRVLGVRVHMPYARPMQLTRNTIPRKVTGCRYRSVQTQLCAKHASQSRIALRSTIAHARRACSDHTFGHCHMHIHVDRQTHRQTDRQTDRQTARARARAPECACACACMRCECTTSLRMPTLLRGSPPLPRQRRS